MADKALYIVGQKRFLQTMRKAGADLAELKEVNASAARVALPAARSRTPVGRTGRLAGSVRAGATQKAGVIRAGSKAVRYAGVVNYGWPARGIRPRLFANDGVASTEGEWAKLYETYVKKVMSQVKGQ